MGRLLTVMLALALASLGGCVLGSEQPPGCRVGHPDDCGSGFVCRAGACFRYNNEAGKPVDPSQDGGADAATAVARDATTG